MNEEERKKGAITDATEAIMSSAVGQVPIVVSNIIDRAYRDGVLRCIEIARESLYEQDKLTRDQEDSNQLVEEIVENIMNEI